MWKFPFSGGVSRIPRGEKIYVLQSPQSIRPPPVKIPTMESESLVLGVGLCIIYLLFYHKKLFREAHIIALPQLRVICLPKWHSAIRSLSLCL